MQDLISALFDKWAGQPILVIGGGPSVLEDLPELTIKPACVISANEHGTKQKFFPVDLLVNMDQNHCLKKTPMESLLRPLGIPIANRYSWADYRLCDWQIVGNTGLSAIALAAALGGDPVIVTGIDFWMGKQRYFHREEEARRQRRPSHHPAMLRRANKRRIVDLMAAVKGANIRPMSGPLLEYFPVYDPGEKLPPTKPIKYRRAMAGVKPVRVMSDERFRLSGQDLVRPGRAIALSPKEAASAPYRSRVRKLA